MLWRWDCPQPAPHFVSLLVNTAWHSPRENWRQPRLQGVHSSECFSAVLFFGTSFPIPKRVDTLKVLLKPVRMTTAPIQTVHVAGNGSSLTWIMIKERADHRLWMLHLPPLWAWE